MTREEMINEVVKEYFRGGNWQARLKELVREMKKNENNSKSLNWQKWSIAKKDENGRNV